MNIRAQIQAETAISFIYPTLNHSGKESKEQLLGRCRNLRLDATHAKHEEKRWASIDTVTHDDVLNHADNRVMRKRWRDIYSDRRQIFVVTPIQGRLPLDALALAYIAAFSHPEVGILCATGNPVVTSLLYELFVEGKLAPPAIYARLEDALLHKPIAA